MTSFPNAPLGGLLVNCPVCDSQLEAGQVFCPQCGSRVVQGEAPKPEPSMPVMLMAGIGGMIAFFGLSFGLVAAVAEPGFFIVAIVACAIAVALFVLAYVGRRRQLEEWKNRTQKEAAKASCAYCGFQNAVGAHKCESCGAPL